MKVVMVLALGIALLGGGGESRAGTDGRVTSETTVFSSGIQGELEQVVAQHRGDMGIYCRNLKTGDVFEVNASEDFPTASTIKTVVMCAAMDLLASGKGPFQSYYDTMVYDAATSTGGSGIIQNYKDGTKIELKELVHLMITVSDNVGTNMLVGWIGIDTVNGWLVKNGFEQTRMYSSVGGRHIADKKGRADWGMGKTSPREMGRLFEMIATGKAGTTSTTDEMLRVLGHQYFDGGIASGVPPMTYVGSKSGAVSDSRSDNAIVVSPGGTYVLSVYTRNNLNRKWDKTNEADIAIGKVSGLIWRHYNPDSNWEPAAGSENF